MGRPDTFAGIDLTRDQIRQIHQSKDRVASLTKLYGTSTAVVLRIKLRLEPRYFDATKDLPAAPLHRADRDGRTHNWTPTRRAA